MTGVLSGKRAVVTGAAGRIGIDTVRALCEAGARVVMSDFAAEPLEAACESLKDEGHEVAALVADVAREDHVRRLIAFTVETFGGVDIVDNNAGATHFNAQDLNAVDMTVEAWDQITAINARGPMLMCKHAIPHMIAAGGGSIVNISSGQALAGDLTHLAYAASKGAVNSMTRHIATAYGHQGVRCNAIAPGLIIPPGGMSRVPEDVLDIYRRHALVPRTGVPRDIANMVVFLASDLSAYVTGQVISVDGGVLVPAPMAGHLRA